MYAYFDCRAGLSGDMTLAALCHLGLDLAPLRALLHEAGVDCELRQWVETRAAGPGCRVEVDWIAPQPLRHPADMAATLARVRVSPAVRARAQAALDALTRAEAHAHQIPESEVHFHEVGGIDTLVDILGAAWGLEQLGVTRVMASPLPWFSGTVVCEHGVLPLPAPATAYLLQGKPVFSTDATTELVTPTGAALIHTLSDDFADGPTGLVRRMGTGYGARASTAGLRVWLLEAECMDDGARRELVTLLESHMDHLSGEELGAALEALAALPEVLDVLWLPGVTKKNRPGGSLRLVCHPSHAEHVCAAFFRHTHTLGIRCQSMERRILPREACTVEAACGVLAAKRYFVDGQSYVRPESDALKAAAAQKGVGVPALSRQDR